MKKTSDKNQENLDTGEKGTNSPPQNASASKHIELVKNRYDRIALCYDILTARASWFSSNWRRRIWAEAEGRILDAGAGTGKNIPYYPQGSTVTAIDISNSMLEKAKNRAQKLQKEVHLQQMDLLNLTFNDAAFDSIVTTFVLSALPEPSKGIQELKRVLKPGGKLLIAEYAPPRSKPSQHIKKMVDSMAYYFFGPLKLVTEEHLQKAGLTDYKEERFWPTARLWIINNSRDY